MLVFDQQMGNCAQGAAFPALAQTLGGIEWQRLKREAARLIPPP
jgi:hypothetical protein